MMTWDTLVPLAHKVWSSHKEIKLIIKDFCSVSKKIKWYEIGHLSTEARQCLITTAVALIFDSEGRDSFTDIITFHLPHFQMEDLRTFAVLQVTDRW